MKAIILTAAEVKVFLAATSLALEIVDCDDPDIMETNRQARIILDKIHNFCDEHIGNKTLKLKIR